MLTTSLLPALSFASLFLPAASAPTRTHCRCTIYDSSKPWTNPLPSSPTSPNSEFNICSNLGPQLENFRHAQPDLYRSYIQSTAVQKVSGTPTEDDLQPLSTTVLLRATTQEGLESLGIVLPSAPTERPREIVVCYPEPEAVTAYQDSETTLLALQVIVALVMLACIAEGVISVSDWLERRKNQKRTLRLTGAERLLRAPTRADLEFVFSPGAEKKMQAYQSPEWVTRTPCEKREFTAYLIRIEEEDDDDEMNRPVM